MADRREIVLEALGKRIARQGDMAIRVHRNTMRIIMKLLGQGDWEFGEDNFREIDALALDMLRDLAWQRAIFGDRIHG